MIATDRQAFDELDRFRRLRKMQFALALHEIDDRALTTSLSITQVAYWKWLVFRVELLKTLISNSIDVLLFETDAVWFKCAFDEWRKERISSKSVAVDIFGVADGSSARQMGFGFLRIRSNQRTKALWTTLDSRFRDAVSKLHTDKDAARVQSEQAILNELLKNSESTTKNAVSYSMLPRSEYVDGSFYSDDIRRNSCPTPVLINNNFIVGVEAKVERARKWNHYFLDRNSLCIDATLLSQTLGGWEPLERTNLHWKGCYPPYPFSEKWCRCCKNDAMNFKKTCLTNGFCSTHCTEYNANYCNDDELQRNVNCTNRFIIFPTTFDLRRALSISATIDRTILLNDEQSKHRIVERFCYMTVGEFRDLFVQRMHLGVIDTTNSQHQPTTKKCDVFCNHETAFEEYLDASSATFAQNILSILKKQQDIMIIKITAY